MIPPSFSVEEIEQEIARALAMPYGHTARESAMEQILTTLHHALQSGQVAILSREDREIVAQGLYLALSEGDKRLTGQERKRQKTHLKLAPPSPRDAQDQTIRELREGFTHCRQCGHVEIK